MDTIPFFCDPRYVNAHSASASANVDGLCPEQVVTDDVQQQQQQMWLGGFANGDLPSFFAPAHLDDPAFGASPHAKAVGSQATILSSDYQYFQPSAPVYNSTLDAGTEQVYVPLPEVNIGGPVTADYGLQFPMQDCNMMYNGGPIYVNSADCSPPPYTAYPEPTGTYTHPQMEIPDYSTLAPNVVQPVTDDKRSKVFAQAANNTVTFVEGHVFRTVRPTRRTRKVKKSKKAARMAGEYDWVACNVVPVKDEHDPDCPPTYRVTSRSLTGVCGSGAKGPTGQKRPRIKLVVVGPDGKDKVLLFRACVVRFSARCEWDGCQEVVWTDRRSIREHLESTHGVHWEPLNRIACLWESCQSDVLIDSLFRHVTNSHMKVIRAPPVACVHGRGDDYARVDGQEEFHSPQVCA
ncbi:hypothetical protein APHAL10511_000377 [Amanita phalloides]|nr:hypothetical protein APHAL10511_000377 [Amanita phalloides]